MSIQTLEQRLVNPVDNQRIPYPQADSRGDNAPGLVVEHDRAHHPTMTFVAFWPIVDQRVPYDQLIAEAEPEVAELACRAHAHITNLGRGRWSIARSSAVPGSGRVTPTVLMYEAPAVAAVPAWRMGRAS